MPASRLRASSTLLLTLDGLVVAAFGYAALPDSTAGDLWIAGLAVAHLALAWRRCAQRE